MVLLFNSSVEIIMVKTVHSKCMCCSGGKKIYTSISSVGRLSAYFACGVLSVVGTNMK